MMPCKLCDRSFTQSHGNQKYCSARCRLLGGRVWTYGNMTLEHAREMLRARVCAACGIEFNKAFKWKYCSNACYYKYKISRTYTLQYRYGLSEQDYEAMFTKQGGLCGVCKKPPETGTRFVVDHDHKTGRVRGLLCNTCNTTVGRYESLKKGIDEYLSSTT